MSTSQPSQGLLGLDRTNTAFHPDTFLRSPSATEPSTASVSSNGENKVHFDGESVGESSGTQPTSIASADAPEADEDNSKTPKCTRRKSRSHLDSTREPTPYFE